MPGEENAPVLVTIDSPVTVTGVAYRLQVVRVIKARLSFASMHETVMPFRGWPDSARLTKFIGHIRQFMKFRFDFP